MKAQRYTATPETLTEGKMPEYTLVDAQGRAIVALGGSSALAPLPASATAISNASGNVANAAAVATLPAVASVLNYLTGFIITASGSTAALVVDVTVTGLLGGTWTFSFTFPAGATVGADPLIVMLPTPIPASAVNTAIVVTLPAGGAGNAHAGVAAMGFKI